MAPVRVRNRSTGGSQKQVKQTYSINFEFLLLLCLLRNVSSSTFTSSVSGFSYFYVAVLILCDSFSYPDQPLSRSHLKTSGVKVFCR